MVWIHEVDCARNMDESKSSNSSLGRNMSDFEVLDRKIASALNKLMAADFKRRLNMEQQEA